MDDLENIVKTELSKHREGCQDMEVLAVETRHEEGVNQENTVFEYTVECKNRGLEEICEVFFVKNMSKSSKEVENFTIDCKGIE